MEKKNQTVTANRQNVADKTAFNECVEKLEMFSRAAAARELRVHFLKLSFEELASALAPWGITSEQVKSSFEETIEKGFIVTQNDKQRSETEIESRWSKKEISTTVGVGPNGDPVLGYICTPKELLTGIRVGVKYAAAVKRLREDPEAAARAKAAREMREKLARIDELTAQMLAAATAGDMATVATVAAQIQARKK